MVDRAQWRSWGWGGDCFRMRSQGRPPGVGDLSIEPEASSESESKGKQLKKEMASGNWRHLNGKGKWTPRPLRRIPNFPLLMPTCTTGNLLLPWLTQLNPVWFSNWHSNWLFFAELCEIRHLVNWHYGGGKRVFAATAQNILLQTFPEAPLPQWK